MTGLSTVLDQKFGVPRGQEPGIAGRRRIGGVSGLAGHGAVSEYRLRRDFSQRSQTKCKSAILMFQIADIYGSIPLVGATNSPLPPVLSSKARPKRAQVRYAKTQTLFPPDRPTKPNDGDTKPETMPIRFDLIRDDERDREEALASARLELSVRPWSRRAGRSGSADR